MIVYFQNAVTNFDVGLVEIGHTVNLRSIWQTLHCDDNKKQQLIGDQSCTQLRCHSIPGVQRDWRVNCGDVYLGTYV